jgi:hypothetical protein
MSGDEVADVSGGIRRMALEAASRPASAAAFEADVLMRESQAPSHPLSQGAAGGAAEEYVGEHIGELSPVSHAQTVITSHTHVPERSYSACCSSTSSSLNSGLLRSSCGHY